MKNTRPWRIWNSMRSRCFNPRRKDFFRYGGAGITVCTRWGHFHLFWADMGPKYHPNKQLDRIDNSKGYNPRNCRWVTPREQQRNRRSNVTVQTPKGLMLLVEASEIFKIPYGCLKMRHLHWPVHRLLEPKRPHTRKCTTPPSRIKS